MSIEICEARKRILDAGGHVLVTGGPGSGKTTIAILKARKRMEEGLLNGQAVLFLSFSKAAVARIQEASKAEVSKDLLSQIQIQTFHSFFWEILRANGYLLGAPRRLKVLLPHEERAIRNGQKDETEQWVQERERMFYEQGVVAFDLFASKALQVLQGSKVISQLICNRFPLIIVDEAQDTAEDQWECLKVLSSMSQLLCLADLDQQIFEFRPGVSSERVAHISSFLDPDRVDLGSENKRSPTNEIVAFGNDILHSQPRGKAYKGVSRRKMPPKAAARDGWIRKSLGIVKRCVRDATGVDPQGIAFLTSWGKGVALISNALRGATQDEEIRHEVLSDEGEVFLAGQIVAYCLEPRSSCSPLEELPGLFEMIVPVLRARGTLASQKETAQLTKWSTEARAGNVPRGGAAKKGISILEELKKHYFTGKPAEDWSFVRELFLKSGVRLFEGLMADTDHLMSFERGKQISAGLASSWQEMGAYVNARETLKTVLEYEQLLSGIRPHRGISVMTIHKAKGKEFDAVIVVDDARNSPLTSNHEASPHPKSRRLLRVAVTRARHHALLLTDVTTPCPLLQGHDL